MRLSLMSALLGAAALSASAAHAAQGPATPPAFPLHLFTKSFFLPDNNAKAIGYGSGPALGVTSLTFSNFSTVTQQVYVAQALTSGSSCSGTVTGGGDTPSNYFLLPPQQTTHLPFPTPLAVPHISGVSCLSFQVTTSLQGGSVDVLVNGFTN